jgi:enoyl-CoA hydratase/carnithine racemase
MINAQFGLVWVRQDMHVAVVEFDRAPHNFVSVELVRDIADALEAVDSDRDARVSVLCSVGRSFSAGADLASPTGVGGAGMSGIGPLYEQAVRLFSVKKPVIAAVQGAAVGAGLGLALVADFRVVAPEARFSANFVKLGFHPGFGISHTLPRVVGEQRAALMCLTGRRIKGEEALAWGLADALVPQDRLREAALELAREIAAAAPLAVVATRATLRAGLAEAVRRQTAHELAEQTWLRATADFAEGVRSVNERREGQFTGA